MPGAKPRDPPFSPWQKILENPKPSLRRRGFDFCSCRMIIFLIPPLFFSLQAYLKDCALVHSLTNWKRNEEKKGFVVGSMHVIGPDSIVRGEGALNDGRNASVLFGLSCLLTYLAQTLPPWGFVSAWRGFDSYPCKVCLKIMSQEWVASALQSHLLHGSSLEGQKKEPCCKRQ